MPARRFDVALVERGLAASRSQAQQAIAAGDALLNGAPCRRASQAVSDGDALALAAPPAYVGRGGVKLAAALAAFPVGVSGACCLDVGASTGGFTDCLLRHGAERVTAIDVGSGQMAARLLADPRVELREGVNARDLPVPGVTGPYAVVVADVSFISLTLLAAPLSSLLARPDGRLIALVKPQFEVGAGRLGRGGIVRGDALRREALASVTRAFAGAGLAALGVIDSPIAGGDGNREYLACFAPAPKPAAAAVTTDTV